MSREDIRQIIPLDIATLNPDNSQFDPMGAPALWSKLSGTNASSAVTRSTSYAYEGAASTFLDTGATVPLTNDTITAQKIGLSAPNRFVTYGLKMSPTSNVALLQFTLQLRLQRSGRDLYAALRFNSATPSLSYLDSSNNYIALTPVPLIIAVTNWVNIEFTLDLQQKKYILAKFGDNIYDLSNIAFYDAGAATSQYCYCSAALQTLSDFRAIAYIAHSKLIYSMSK